MGNSAYECIERQVSVGNGSFLPIKLKWVFVEAPGDVVQDLALGNRVGLDVATLESMAGWNEIEPERAPFQVEIFTL